MRGEAPIGRRRRSRRKSARPSAPPTQEELELRRSLKKHREMQRSSDPQAASLGRVMERLSPLKTKLRERDLVARVLEQSIFEDVRAAGDPFSGKRGLRGSEDCPEGLRRTVRDNRLRRVKARGRARRAARAAAGVRQVSNG